MIIERIEIVCFGKLEHFAVDLSPDFNLIEGANESGKSTLAAFIRFMLYGFAEPQENGFSEREHRVSRTEGKAEGSMILRTAEGRYRIDRISVRAGGGYRDECITTDLLTGQTDTSTRAPGERFLGVPGMVYDDTALFVRPTDGAVHGVAMAQAIENLLFSGSEKMNTKRAVDVLENMRLQLVPEGERGGAISILEAEKQGLVRRLQKAREDADTLLEKENLLYDTKRKRRDAGAELDKFERLRTDYRNAVTIRAYDRLHQAEMASDEKAKEMAAFEELHQVNGFMPDTSYLAEIATTRAAWRDAKKQEKKAKSELADVVAMPLPADEMEELYIRCVEEGGGADTIREKSKELRRNIVRHTVLLGLLSALFGLGIVGLLVTLFTVRHVLLLCLCAAVALAGLGGAGMAFWERRRNSRERGLLFVSCEAGNEQELEENLQKAAAASTRLAERMALLEQVKRVAEKAEEVSAFAWKGLEHVTERWGCALTEDRAEEQIENLLQQAGECIREYNTLVLAKETVNAEVHTLRLSLEGESEIAVRALVAPADRTRLCNLNEGDLRNGVEHYRRMSTEFSAKEEALEKELAGLALGENPAAVAEELAALEERIAALREKAHTYAAAAQVILQTTAQLKDEVSPRLSSYACQMLDDMTDGRYTHMHISEDMELTFTDEGGVAYPAEALSSGTLEMTYLALRMALSDLIYREFPPFLFDECMAFQDETRATALMRAIAAVADDGKQCLLFSCHDREAVLAKRVFASPRIIRL